MAPKKPNPDFTDQSDVIDLDDTQPIPVDPSLFSTEDQTASTSDSIENKAKSPGYRFSPSPEIQPVIRAVTSNNEAIIRILRQQQREYLPASDVAPVFNKISPQHKDILGRPPRVRLVPATKKLFEILTTHPTVKDFMVEQPYYADFKERTSQLGISDDFDFHPTPLPFQIPIEESNEQDFQSVKTILQKEATALQSRSNVKLNSSLFEKAVQMDLNKIRTKLMQIDPMNDEYVNLVIKYFNLIFLQAKKQNSSLIEAITKDLEEDNLLSALGKLNEFYRDKIGNEIISLEPEPKIRAALRIILDQKLEIINEQFKNFDLASFEKKEDVKMANFTLEADPRDADSLLRGTISCDCTDIIADYAFHETIPQHLLDPGFLNFRLFQDDKWVGNVYCLVVKDNNDTPIFIIDAVQTSETHKFPAKTPVIAEAIIEQIKKFAEEAGFKKTYLSKFVSNRGLLHYYLDTQYPTEEVEIEKIGGFEHLRALGLWNEKSFRNEYLETFMAGSPNMEKQTIPLRKV